MNRRLAARVTGSVVLAAGMVAAVAMPAASDPAPAPAPKDDSVLGAMQRDLGLTTDQARQRLNLEAVANKASETLRGALQGSFGGAHYDAGLGKLVVGVTNPADFDQVRAQGAEPRLVTFTSQQLDAVKQGLQRRPAPKSVSGWYVESSSDSVVMTTAPGTAQQARDFIGESGVDPQAVRVVESPETPRPRADVMGGNPYTIGGSSRCSVGFAVNGGFVSAGHCGRQGDPTTNPNGTFAASSFPDNDYSFVRLAGDTPRPLVNNYAGGAVGVAGSSEAVEGTSVCRSGSTSGWHCGTIQAKGQSVNYPQGVVNGLTRTDVCSEPGDSGGSFLSGDQAQGTTSGGSGNCSSGGTTYFQPVNEALDALGVSLLTQ